MLASRSVTQMLARWRQHGGVTAEHVHRACQQVRQRSPSLAFGPAYIANLVVELAEGKTTTNERPDWMCLPYDDEQLWPWAKRHGYPGPGAMTYQQYRARLRAEIEKRMHERRAG